MTAPTIGTKVPYSGDAMTRFPEDLESVGQPNYTRATELAESRLWGNAVHTFAPNGKRRTLSIGYAHRGDDMVYSTGQPHPLFPGVRVWEFAE